METINKLKVAKRKQKKQDKAKAKEEETHITHRQLFCSISSCQRSCWKNNRPSGSTQPPTHVRRQKVKLLSLSPKLFFLTFLDSSGVTQAFCFYKKGTPYFYFRLMISTKNSVQFSVCLSVFGYFRISLSQLIKENSPIQKDIEIVF